MEKHSAKSGSFIGRHRWRSNLQESHRSSFSPRIHQKSPVVVPDPHLSDDQSSDEDDVDVKVVDEHQLLSQIDAFIHEVSTAEHKPQLPEVVEVTFSSVVKSRTRSRSRKQPPADVDDAFLHESVRRLSQLKPHFEQFEKLLHRVMVFLEEQLRTALLVDIDDSNLEPEPEPKLKVISSKHFSFKADRSPLPKPTSKEDDYPGFSHDTITRINTIVTTMISAGYNNQCSNVYTIARGNALYHQLTRLDFQKLNPDDLHKLNWDSLEADLARWIRVINHCSHFLIPAERKLGQSVFSHHIWLFRGLFLNLIRSLITSLLDYAATVATMKRSAEKLFKFLDMYEALEGLREAILILMIKDEDEDEDEDKDKDKDKDEDKDKDKDEDKYKDKDNDNHNHNHNHIHEDEEEHHSESNLEKDISSMTERIGEGVVNMFADLEKSIRQDAAKTPVPGGAVHPLTRYVLNYLKYACDYGDTLDHIFRHNAKLNQPSLTSSSDDTDMDKSPLAAQIASIMSLLDGNLAIKSTLYKDPSLRNVFLMNNGRYILQKVKGSNEIKKLMGDNWCRRRSSEVRHYHKSYQRETWARLLQCIAQEGIHVNGKLNKQLLKERFKNFNTMFDDIHKTQSSWVVSDDQLQSELRASISAVVIPAYRSFVGRYKHHFDARKNMDKYIKYQPEDIEALIETLFEGNAPQSMSRRRF